VYSDYTCPWCYIGSRRLDRLRADVGEDVRLDVEWKPFEIHPEVPPGGMPVEDLGYPEERWEVMQAHLRHQAAAEGIEVGNRPKVSNTHQALAASVYAQEEEPQRFPSFHEGLFRAYFSEGRDLGDEGVILDVAEDAGLDVDALEAALEDRRYDAALEEASREARRRGITGTPTYVFGSRHGAVGAQPVERLRDALERALEEDAGAFAGEA
ncbi:MAG TPA: DsbA family oxidoreductase, partial [Longimicrobiales bacterium]|nr:DsbA family oxidoreductase [Longimicrobiales bacterium]